MRRDWASSIHVPLLAASLAVLDAANAQVVPTTPPATVFVGSASTPGNFHLVRVALDSTTQQANTTEIMALPGWILEQGDASAWDHATETYFATLNDVTKMPQETSLYAISAQSGHVLWSYKFPTNHSTSAIAVCHRL